MCKMGLVRRRVDEKESELVGSIFLFLHYTAPDLVELPTENELADAEENVADEREDHTKELEKQYERAAYADHK